MSQLQETFRRLKREGKAAFIPYITAFDPDAPTSRRLVEILARAGADAIELGVPFSDPLADGSDNQKAAQRALRRPVGLTDVLRLAGWARRRFGTPIVLFVYYNSIYNLGLASFAAACRREGVAGAVVPDLACEESGPLRRALAGSGTDLIQFITPTTPPARRRLLLKAARGFIYYISLTGVTGRRRRLASDLKERLAELRRETRLPLAVGFGISTPQQARKVAQLADGVIVGSALVSLVERHGGGEKLYRAFSRFAGALVRAIHSVKKPSAK